MSNFTPPIVATTSGGASAADVDIVVSVYEATAADTQMAAGDTLQRISYIKTSDQTTAGVDRWINLSTLVTLTAAPPVAKIKPQKFSSAAGDLTAVTLTTSEKADSALMAAFGAKADPVADSSGSFSLISLVKRIAELAVSILGKLPSLVNGKIPVEASLSSWETVEYKLDASGAVVYEKEKNGTSVRSRTWVSTTDANGVVSYVAGEWA